MTDQEFLPEPLPADPMPLFDAWCREARQRNVQPNSNAMVLATVDRTGKPSARIVLCKQISVEAGYIVFFTNYRSRKGRELHAHPHTAAVFHWDTLHRQVRIEGRVLLSPQSESDEYFAQRPLDSRIAAWASDQSQPLASRAALAEQVRSTAARFGIAPGATSGTVPRPPYWGGYRLWIESIELWLEGPNRVHDRAIWTRELASKDEFSMHGGEWKSTRLNP